MSKGLSESWFLGNHSGKVQFRDETLRELSRLRGELRDGVDWSPEELLWHLSEWVSENYKGQNKSSHTHEIEVFGAPCDCGTRHEYCGDCDWVEPCEPEGENK